MSRLLPPSLRFHVSVGLSLAALLSVTATFPAHAISAEPAPRAAGSATQPQGWRGDGSGRFQVARSPRQWDRQQGVAWATPMTAMSNAHPVVLDDCVMTCADPHSLLCLDRASGEIRWTLTASDEDAVEPALWTKIAAELEQAEPLQREEQQLERELRRMGNRLQKKVDAKDQPLTPAGLKQLEQDIARAEARRAELGTLLAKLPLAQKHRTLPTHGRKNGYTTATPVSNGTHVWAVFGNAVVMCCTVEGERVWTKKMEDRPHAMFGHSASPLLAGNRLIVAIEDTVALDALTGRELWRTRFGQSWGTPALYPLEGGDVLVHPNGRILDVATGEKLARLRLTLSNSSPVVAGGDVFCIDTRAGRYTLSRDGSGEVQIETVWQARLKGGKIFASPVIHDGKVYTVSADGLLLVVAAASGKTLREQQLDLGQGTYYPSLALAEGLLYVSSENGTTVVLEATDELTEVARNQVDAFIGTPVFAGDSMYLRTHGFLYRITGTGGNPGQ